MYRFAILFLINFSFPHIINGEIEKLREIYTWKSLDFLYPSPDARQQAINNGSFIPGAGLPIDIDIPKFLPGNEHRLFITIPRFKNGVPVTLGYITNRAESNGPLIAPYPNWEMNTLDKNCNGLISVFRIAVDECNRLWILDTGKVVDEQICPPKLLLFDSVTDRFISKYQLPSDYVYNTSLFVTPIIDIRNNKCADAFVYIADIQKYQLIVYDHRNRKSWNIQNQLFVAQPEYSNFTINNESYHIMDGIIGLALGPLDNGDRKLYFHSLSSLTENFVHTSVIRNSRIFQGNPDAANSYFRSYNYKRPSQSAAEVMDKNGILFYGLLTQTAIACWNSKNNPEFNKNDVAVLIQNAETLQFPSGIKLFTSSKGRDELWIITMRFQKFMANTFSLNETNFRIQAGYVDEIIRGTTCVPHNNNDCKHNQCSHHY